ncbi:MAG TPA: alpha/beta fold hydrolase [Rubrobacter sp.]|nr:alpha/beta fold hydrolase [Rubrobacter sp.]
MPRKFVPLCCLLLLLSTALQVQAQPANPPAAPPSDDLTAKATALLEAMVRGDFAGATRHFDATMKQALTPEKLQEVWKGLIGQAGAFQRQAGTRIQTQGAHRLVFVTTEFEKVRLDMQVTFDAQGQIAGLFFIPAPPPAPAAGDAGPPYARKDAYSEREVTVGSGEWALPGTLTLPVGTGPFPAVVLVHGSGPHDRDETFGPNKPFRDLAWGLASRGVAVLRYEKRTKAHAGSLARIARPTVREEVIDDALAAAALLRKTEGIDPKRVHVLGHSLGATLLPRIGQADPEIAGLIALAGTARPLQDVMVEQISYLASLDGAVSEEEKAQIETFRQQAGEIGELKEDSTGAPFGVPASYWLDLRGYDPPAAAKDLAQPLLILQGERDYQVTMADFEAWKKALAARKDVTFKSYPKLNHLFMEGKGKSAPLEYQTAGHVAPAVIEDVAGWITSVGSSPRPPA